MAPPYRPVTPSTLSWGKQAAANGPSTNSITLDPLLKAFLPSGNPIANARNSVNAVDQALGSSRGNALSAQQTQQRVSPAGTDASTSGPLATTTPAKAPTVKGTDVSGMQKFLVGHGYNIAVDGVNGPQTQAAAADFRGSRNPTAFNTGHGLITPTAAGPASTDNSSTGPAATPTKTAPVKTAPARVTAAAPASAASTQQTDTAAAKAQISTILAPVIQQIRDAENARAAAGQSAITGYTNSTENALKGIDFGAPSAQAGAGQNAINTALLAQLQGQGSGLQNELGGELAKAGLSPDQTSALTGRVASDTAGAAGAGLAKGDATLSSILQSGAAASDYGNKLPGIEALAGAQDTGKLQGGVSQDLNTQLSGVESKVPGMVQSALTALSSARTAQERNQIAALIAAGKTDEALKVAQMNNQTKLTIAGAGNATKLQVAAQNAAAKAAGLSTKGQLTDSQISKLVDGWKNGKLSSVTTIARDAKGNPIPNSAGAPETTTQTVPTGTLDYGQAYQRLISFGKTDQQARALLNTAYKRGEQGRAWVTNEEQAALTAAKLPTNVAVLPTKNGKQGVLTMKQYQVLHAAGKLPPGKLYAEGYLIDPGY